MIPSPRTIEGVSKLGVLRPGAIGDVIVTLPALESLRLAFPGAEIVLLGREWCPSLLGNGRTAVNRFITVPCIKGINDGNNTADAGGEDAFLSVLKDEAFDIIINLQGRGLSANPLLFRSGARFVASFHGPGVEEVDISIAYRFEQHETMRALELAMSIGGMPVLPDPCIKVLPEDELGPMEIFPMLRDQEFAIINPFSTDARRNWPLHNYEPVITYVLEQGMKVVLTGSECQRDDLEQIRGGNNDVINSAGAIQLNELAAIMKKAQFLLAPDTGPLHLARAVGCTTIGIFWAPNFLHWGPLLCSRHKSIISWDLRCPLCGIIPNQPHPFEPREECEHNISFVRNISPEMVIREIDALLTTTPQTI